MNFGVPALHAPTVQLFGEPTSAYHSAQGTTKETAHVEERLSSPFYPNAGCHLTV